MRSDAPSDPLAVLWRRGRARWPDLALPEARFAEHVAPLLPPPPFDTTSIHAEDLYLGCACLSSVAGAAEQLAEEIRGALAGFVAPAVKSRRAMGDLANDLLADVLLGTPHSAPRLASYAGRGPLRAWLRMLVVRRSLNAARDSGRHARIERRIVFEATQATADPEIAIIRRRYGGTFEVAFRDAMRALAAGDRALLRLHYGQALPLGTIATMYGSSKATACRRLADAREALLARTCELLRQRLSVDAAELESLLRVLRSQLDLSSIGALG